jgi:hypothetical protein
MSDDYIPDNDARALGWMQTFAAGLVSSPSVYMVSAAEAAGIQSAVDAFAAAYADAIDPAQRTPVVVAIKDSTRNAAAQLCRQYAGLIKLNIGITDADKIAIGVRPVNPNREPIHCPQTAPKLNVIAATLTNPTTLALTFSAAIATATSLNIPIEDAAIRNASGGYANAGTFPA